MKQVQYKQYNIRSEDFVDARRREILVQQGGGFYLPMDIRTVFEMRPGLKKEKIALSCKLGGPKISFLQTANRVK